jgi:hypothetical protein
LKPKLFIFALLAMVMAGCTHEPLPEPMVKGEEIVTINATMAPETRVAYDDGTRKLMWESQDELILAGYQGSTYNGNSTFTKNGNGNSFSGKPVTGASTYIAYYPGGAVTLDENGNLQPFTNTCWQQTQDGNNTTAHLSGKLIMSNEEAIPINQTFSLALISSIIKFNLSNIPDNLGNLNKLIWTVQTTAEGDTRSAILDITNINMASSGPNLTLFLAFDPVVMKIAAGGKVKVTLIGDRSYEWSHTVNKNVNYQAGNRYTANINGGWTMGQTQFIYTINIDNNNADYEIWQKSAPSTSPANLTIDWGDGKPNTTIAKNASLSKTAIASHRYVKKGNYTVIIYSDQLDPSLKQMPQITFSIKNGVDTYLTTILTPFPNMEATDFSSCFERCKQLACIPVGLFDNNTNATNFSKCFSQCSKLQLAPVMFPNPATDPNYFISRGAMNFQGCFFKVGSATTSPGTAPALWEFNQGATWTTTDCFKNASNLTNHGDIPPSWK